MTFLRTWLTDTALPLWHEAGFADGTGRFHERLDAGARPLVVPLRGMVQARQIFVFAHAACLGWFPGGERAERAMASLRRDFAAERDGAVSFAFAIDPGGAVVEPMRDAYAHAFVLFAIAWLHRLNGDRGLLDLADGVIRYLDDAMHDAQHGGLFDQHPVGDRSKRQNPHMHLLEAYLALDESAPERGYLERAHTLVQLFKQRLFSERHGVLFEYFAQDWADHPEPLKRELFEPGHHFEWIWLLRNYARRSGEDLAMWINALHASAHRHGLAEGLIVDEVAADGRVVKTSHRIWPHTEAIKAAMVFHADGDPDAAAFAGRMVDVLQRHFLGRPFAGGWIDHVDATYRPLVDYVPASSLYHLLLAATEMSASLAEPGLASAR